MFPKVVLTAFSLLAIVSAQQVGNNTAETHPKLSWQKCTASGCTTQSNGAVVLDSNWRWTHTTTGYTNCYTGNEWDSSLCPDGPTCAANCALEGADYPGTYGVTTSGNALTLKYVTQASQKNVGSRLYLLNSDTQYEMFQLMNQEFTFDVDVSQLPCGLNGALYFSEMDADGGMSKHPTNKAGANSLMERQANSEGWEASPNDSNSGTGKYGACCNEMDIWEANSMASAYTPHPCTSDGLERCEGTACGTEDRYATVCDPDGCDFNSFRMGDKSFFGPGLTVDTNSKFTVVTQFISSNNSTSGNLAEIRRIYVQNGRVIQNSKVNIPGMTSGDSITDDFCDEQKQVFGDRTQFQAKGGLTEMGTALKKGMVLVLSIWDDHTANMLWLDSNYPVNASASNPGVARGPCSTDSGKPDEVESQHPDAQVIFSNIRVGDIDTTY
ncbi:Exoglucanase [Termitomyces sp. J132]|nr:Exoglucanase [Termitomyces sp. J132]